MKSTRPFSVSKLIWFHTKPWLRPNFMVIECSEPTLSARLAVRLVTAARKRWPKTALFVPMTCWANKDERCMCIFGKRTELRYYTAGIRGVRYVVRSARSCTSK